MGGKVKVSSEVGVGSIFSVEFKTMCKVPTKTISNEVLQRVSS